MKKNILYFALLTLAAISFASCSKESDTDPVTPSDEVLTPIRISATYEGSATTRVAYTEDGSDITATWQTGDQLYVCYKGNVNTLSLTSGAGTATATFEGTIQGTPNNNSVLICYVRDVNNTSAINFNDNGDYTYAAGPFLLQDGTLAGAAKCNVYSGITTYGTGENIFCSFSVNTSMLKFLVYAPKGVNAGDAATLTYKTDGTELAKASFTVGTNGENTIYMTVPAGQYTGEQTVTYESGTTDESMTLSASKATFTAGTTYSRSLIYSYADLSMVDCAGNARETGKAWTANSYMVHTAGDYKLPLVYGNAIKDGETNAAAYTGVSGQLEKFLRHDGNAITAPWIKDNGITVASADLLWQDAEGLVTAVGIHGDYLTLTVGKDAAEQEGNAVIAAKDGSGTIVWSWHIWVTKETFATLTTIATGEHNYKVTPVNLGWVATGGDGKQGYNTFYQWGRKDAFIPGVEQTNASPNTNHTVYDIENGTVTGFTYTASTEATIADNIQNPTTHYYNSSNEGPCNTMYYNMWDAQNTASNNVTTATVKTVYDPSPAGFCVPTSNLWYFMGNGNSRIMSTWDGTNKGATWSNDVVANSITGEALWFPASGCRDGRSGALYTVTVGSSGYYWSASPYNGDTGRCLSFVSSSWYWYGSYRADGVPVRAVAEE